MFQTEYFDLKGGEREKIMNKEQGKLREKYKDKRRKIKTE